MYLSVAALTLVAQTPSTAPAPGAQQVQLAVPFGVESGQLVVSGDNLMFIDSTHAENSFTVNRSQIQNGKIQNDGLSLELAQPVSIASNQQSTLNFRFDNAAGAQDILHWVQAAQPGSIRTDESGQPGTLSYQVAHDHFIGNDRGRLMITPTQVVYESVTHVNSSRQWNMSDIKEVKRVGPYKLKIKPFTGDEYNFALLGQGMSEDDYKTFVNRVTGARAPRR